MYRAFQCNVCATPLMPGRRIDCRYCGVRCRVKAHRIRYDGRGLLDVEYHHIVERVIRVAVPANDTQLPQQPEGAAAVSDGELSVEEERESAKDAEAHAEARPAVQVGEDPSPLIGPVRAAREDEQRPSSIDSATHIGPVLVAPAFLDERSGAARVGSAGAPQLELSFSEPPSPPATAVTSGGPPASQAQHAESEAQTAELKERLRQAEDKVAQQTELLSQQTELKQQLFGMRRSLGAAVESFNTSQAQLVAKRKDYEELLAQALELKRRLDDVRRKLAQREEQLRMALDEIEALSQKRGSHPAGPTRSTAPAGTQDAEQRRQMTALVAMVQSLKEQLARAKSDQDELAQRREEVGRMKAVAEASRKQFLDAAHDRDALRRECSGLTQQVATLTQKLRQHEAGTWNAMASGVVGVAADLAHAYAEKEGIRLPPPAPPVAKPTPPQHPPPAPAPPPEDPETKRWREVIAEQRRRGWNPSDDLLVMYKLDEVRAEDELARAQEKAGVAVTVRKLLPSMDSHFLAQRAALEARHEHHRTHSDGRSLLERTKWEKEHYRLDMLSEGRLQSASTNRYTQLQDELYELRSRRR